MDEISLEWGRNLRENLAAQGKNARWLAMELGIAPSSVSRWLSSKAVPSDRHKIEIARLLNISARTLFPLNGDVK